MQDPNRNPSDDALERALGLLYSTEEPPAGFDAAWRAAVRREESMQMKTKPQPARRFWRTAIPALAAVVLIAGSLWTGAQRLDAPQTENELAAAPAAYDTGGVSRAAKGGAGLNGLSLSSGQSAGTASDEAVEPSAYQTEGDGAPAGETRQKLVRTADLTIRSVAFDADVESVQALLQELDGYVESLYQYGDEQNDRTRAISLSMRVPSEKLDLFLAGMEGIGRVTDRSESTTDMTVQYADNEARLNTLYEKRTRLNELLKQAETVGDLVEIESAISDTQYQIDSYETSQRGIDRRVEMSAVSVTVMEETPAESAAAEDRSLGARISAGFSASLKWLGEFFRNMLVFIVMILPVLAPLAVVALIIWLAVRRRRQRAVKPTDGGEGTKEE